MRFGASKASRYDNGNQPLTAQNASEKQKTVFVITKPRSSIEKSADRCGLAQTTFSRPGLFLICWRDTGVRENSTCRPGLCWRVAKGSSRCPQDLYVPTTELVSLRRHNSALASVKVRP